MVQDCWTVHHNHQRGGKQYAMASARPTAIRRRCHQGLLSFTSFISLRVSISPAVADEEDHSAKSSANQALPLTAVCASTCRTRLEAADGRTSATYFIRMACESEAELSVETMLTTDRSIGKKPSRNQ